MLMLMLTRSMDREDVVEFFQANCAADAGYTGADADYTDAVAEADQADADADAHVDAHVDEEQGCCRVFSGQLCCFREVTRSLGER